MQDASAAVCRSLRWLSALLAVMPLTAALSCQSEQPIEAGGLVLNLESDLTMPKDIDAISVEVVSESGEMLLNQHYSLGPGVGRHLLPYQVRVDAKGLAGKVKAQVVALKHGVARMERSAQVELPGQRWGAVSLPLNFLCDGTVDQNGAAVSSSCGEGQTCDQGRCVSNAVVEAPEYSAAAGGGGGGGISLADLAKDDNCMSVIDCMSDGLTVQVDTSTCSFDVPVNASGFLNVALKTAKDGFCGPKGCWLPLKFGHAGGWTTNGTTVFLPQAVCFEDPTSARFQVTVSDACQTFLPSLLMCGVAAVTEEVSSTSMSMPASTTTLQAATTSACAGPASRPCPSCGRQTRTCDAKTATWSKWSSCTGAGECALGEFVLNGCPGGMPQVCGPFCEWIPCCNPATCLGGRCSDGVCCGNGVIEGSETCEGDCTTEKDCDDGIACTKDTYTGSVSTCRAKCTHTPIIADGDGCCAPGVGPSADSDCQTKLCGNGKVDLGETCDGNCPTKEATDCDDGIVCTRDTIADIGTCNARCRHTPVRDNTDKCCAPGQTSSDDVDCQCGNGAIDPGEFCDGDCPTLANCNDNNPCTTDSLVGSAKDCSAHCVNKPIVVPGDHCCAPGQTHETDSDCQVAPGCGNGIIEGKEICDGDSCPTPKSCVDMDPRPCVDDVYQGSVATCDARCVRVITRINGDGCCPPPEPGREPDTDCKPICGNGILDMKEVCEPDPLSSMTPACPSDEACKSLSACLTANTGADRCNTPCVRDAKIPDGACEVCGDRVLQMGELCEPHPFDSKSVCPADSECKIKNGPCYVANTGMDQCVKPCLLDPKATNCEPPPSCGNGTLDKGEMCDPLALDPKQRCATDMECKANGACLVANTTSSQCVKPCVDNTAGCMMPNMMKPPTTGGADVCGDGVKGATEMCDTAASGPNACPAKDVECDDKDECTSDHVRMAADRCVKPCEHTPIMGCLPGMEKKPEPKCGDGVVSGDEKCDPKATGKGKCPASAADCDDHNSCTTDKLLVGADECQAMCSNVAIDPCPGGTAGMPAPPVCGDGMVNGMELCDPKAAGSGKCPTDPEIDCPKPKDACTEATIEGTGCAAKCGTAMRHAANGDGCCPQGASSADDNDCKPIAVCGNDMREGDEECDGKYTGKPCEPEKCIMRVASCMACKNSCVETPIAGCVPETK